MNDVVKLLYDCDLSPSEMTAVTFVCKHMKNLTILETRIDEDCQQEFLELPWLQLPLMFPEPSLVDYDN